MLMVYISSEWVSNIPFIPSASVGGIVRLVYSKVMLFCGFLIGAHDEYERFVKHL